MRQPPPAVLESLDFDAGHRCVDHKPPEGDPVPRPPIYPDRAGTAETLPRVLLALFRPSSECIADDLRSGAFPILGL